MWFGGAVWAVCISVMVGGMALEWLGLWGRFGPGAWAAGLAYIAPAYIALIWLRSGPAGLPNVVFLAAVVWAGDIGAYLAGRQLGGPLLAPSISPGKTWSGAAGGTICAVLAGMAAGWSGRGHAAALSLLLSIVAQAGDLLESAIKRRAGAKDSGWIIPGHGGLLDRLDGVLTAAPVAAICSLAIGPGQVLWR